MISHFFIDRPIFATVLSIVITLAGGIAVFSLPMAQYPPISPPQIQVSINYPGASAQVVADTVAAPIEQQVNGVPGMLYMTSLSGNTGTYTLFVTFEVGTDLNTALVMVQNRVQLAMPLLPVVGAEPGHHHPEEDARYPDGDQCVFSGRPIRRSVPQQLCTTEPVRPAAACGRRVGHFHPGHAAVQHARLARPATARLAQHECGGRGHRGRQPERASGPGARRTTTVGAASL